MKLRNIARKEGKQVNLELKQEKEVIAPNKEFEIENTDRAKELLNIKIDNEPIVELVKDLKENKNKSDNTGE